MVTSALGVQRRTTCGVFGTNRAVECISRNGAFRKLHALDLQGDGDVVKAPEKYDMTQEQLERKMADLEREVAELRCEIKPLRPLRNVPDTFGMFADDPDFEDVVRLGREYRDQANRDQPSAEAP